jgi:hypothetical protein
MGPYPERGGAGGGEEPYTLHKLPNLREAYKFDTLTSAEENASLKKYYVNFDYNVRFVVSTVNNDRVSLPAEDVYHCLLSCW